MNRKSNNEKDGLPDKRNGDPQGNQRPSANRPQRSQRPPSNPWWLWLALVGMIVLASTLMSPTARQQIPTWDDFEAIARKEGLLPDSVVLRNDQIQATLKQDFQ